MKKLFTLLAVAAATMTASAASLVWGYYDGNKVADLGMVGMQMEAVYDIAMKVPGNGLIGGATITGLRMPITSKTNMENLTMWVADNEFNHISEVTPEVATLKNADFNEVALTTPVVIPAEGVYVGVSFEIVNCTTNSDKFPVYYYPGVTDEPDALLLMGENGWVKYGSQFGAYAMQLVLDNVNLSEACAYCKLPESGFLTPGKEYEFPVKVYSDGSVDVKEVEYVVDFAGKQETKTAKVAIAAGINKSGSFNVAVTGPAETGVYPLKVSISKVNGVANTKADVVAEATLSNIDHMPVRRTVVEEFTGTGCGYCPRGLLGMDYLKKNYGDLFIGVGIHQYNSTDAMYNKNYASLGFQGAPSCIIDRKEIMDPFYGTSRSTPAGIAQDFERYNAEIAPVDVALTAHWEEGADFTSTKIVVELEASVTALAPGDYQIAFVLTADGLTGTTSAWKQSNYYYGYDGKSNPGLEEICSGGTYGKSSFSYNFDDVLIASSYSGTTNKADVFDKFEANETKTSTYSLSLPTKTALLKALKNTLDNIYGIAIVTDAEGHVANAVRVRVVNLDGSSINKVQDEVAATPAARYTIDGKQAAQGQKGFSVVRMSDGSVRKELR